jgi:hypothetical protein
MSVWPDPGQAKNRMEASAMHGKVALEEHFAIEQTLQDSAGFSPEADWPELKARLLDCGRWIPTASR